MAANAVAKPQMRNLGMRAWTIAAVASTATASCFAVWFKTNVVEARKKHYKEFYDNYDDDAAFESMRKAGVYKGFEPS